MDTEFGNRLPECKRLEQWRGVGRGGGLGGDLRKGHGAARDSRLLDPETLGWSTIGRFGRRGGSPQVRGPWLLRGAAPR